VAVGAPVPAAGGARRARRTRAELEAFAAERLLGDPELAARCAGNRAVGGLFGPGYWAALGSLALKRFLLLALLLDTAAARGACPPGAPLLFRRGQGVKSTAAVVAQFLRGRLRGEGDTARHLAAAGFRPAYEQDPRAEFDFGVTALAVDLRRRAARAPPPACALLAPGWCCLGRS